MTMLKIIVLLTVVTHALSAVDVCVDYSRDDFCSSFNCNGEYLNFCRVKCKICTQPAPVASSLSLKNDCLGIINAKRRLHQNTPDLTWDGVIEAQAQAVANGAAQSNSFDFGTNNYYGRVAVSYNGAVLSNAEICQKAVSKWYLIGENYDYSVAPSISATHAFTQMIWKSTTKVGFGIARATHNNVVYNYLMAFYHKASNDEYTTNVMPLKTTTPSATTPVPLLPVTTQPPPTTTEAATTQVSGSSNLHENSCLSIHNTLRALHVNTPPLVYDVSIETGAQDYAEYLARNNLFNHSDTAYGENLYYIGTTNPTNDDKADCKIATNGWYDEIDLYDYNNPIFSQETGHFTQVVWSSTTKLGVGIARSTLNGITEIYVVARYSARGNVGGQFSSNVKPLKT